MALNEITPFEHCDEDTKKLLEASIDAREKAYAPYSKFKVGAALLTASGHIVTGCNVENAVYPLTNCAERTAVVKAVSEGYTRFHSVAICGRFEDRNDFVTPCGSCRQSIAEFQIQGHDIKVFLVRPDRDRVLRTTLNALLPLSFTSF